MHVGFEVIAAGSALDEGAGGASGYIEGLVPHVLADGRVERLTAYVADWYRPARSWSHPKLRVRWCRAPRNRAGRVGYEQGVLPALATRDRVDVLFSPANFRPLAYHRPNVVALHAIQHFVLGDDIGRVRSLYVKQAVPRSARSADLVVAVTETLRRDAIKLFDLDPARIVAVPMGPSPWVLDLQQNAPPTPHRTREGAPFILSISRLYALKNHRRLIEAYAELVSAGIEHRLVIVGGDADVTAAELFDVARRCGVERRVDFLGRVPQADVPGLYAGADVVAYVSLYETFGHPVLEAFATGTPLVTSGTGATSEVAGGAARLVDPTSVADIAAGLLETIGDADVRARMQRAGHRRVLEFSWEKCAAGTIDALATAVGRRGAGAA